MKLRNWNNLPFKVQAQPFATRPDAVPRGNGRNYGDGALGETVVSTLGNRPALRIENDCLIAGSGWLLRDIVAFCIRNGYWFPVLPGTQYVTVGGMIAADVHGKDHVRTGTIGRWVRALTLRLSDGTVLSCSPVHHPDVFRITIGGMGVSGTILEAQLQLEPLTGLQLRQETIVCADFDAVMQTFAATEQRFSVAWADGFRSDRYVVTRADFVPHSTPANVQLRPPLLTVPQTGIRWVSRPLMQWYNRRYYRKAVQHRQTVTSLDAHFFPLDRIAYWNRLYGRKGLLQYQFIVPKEQAKTCWTTVRNLLDASGFQPYLIVIKQHGALESPGILSFPMEGYSFALDFPRSEALIPVIRSLNEWVIKAGGRVYLAKDAITQADECNRMYPQSDQFRQLLAALPAVPIRSQLAQRLGWVNSSD